MSDEITFSERGFARFGETPSRYGHRVQVYESSAAAEQCLWVNVQGSVHLEGPVTPHPLTEGIADGSAAAHLNMEQAEDLHARLGRAIEYLKGRDS